MKKKLLLFILGSLFVFAHAFAQQKTVSGKVIFSDDKLPIPGASVKIKGSSTVAQSGPDGVYTIKALPTDVLVFSYVSMATQEHAVGTNSTINVSLKADNNDLNEVVVVGYGTQKKANLTGAVTTVDTKMLQAAQLPM